MTKELFIARLTELCRDASVCLQGFDDYDGNDRLCGKEWHFVSTCRNGNSPWSLAVDGELAQATGCTND